MFFLFAGGVEQQVRQLIKSGAGKCIRCGSKADLVEYEKVLKFFFVPVWRWPGKHPLLHCQNCSLFFPLPPPTDHSPPQSSAVPISLCCPSCDRLVHSDFRFCPFCGSSL